MNVAADSRTDGADSAARVAAVLAPSGQLRAAINFGNIALAQHDTATGKVSGVAVELAQMLANSLGVTLSIVPYEAAGRVVDSLEGDAWDISFLAADPLRATKLVFTHPYAQIATCYMVPQASVLQHAADVDAPGVRVAVGDGAAYDLYLTRHLKHAVLQRFETAAASFATFEALSLEAAAGVRRVLQRYVETRPYLRVLPDDFQVVSQAVCVPRSKVENHPEVLAWLNEQVEACKRNGWVAAALAAGGPTDAQVAPAAVSISSN